MHKNILLCVGITILFLGLVVAPLTQGIVTRESNVPISNGITLYVGGTGEGNYTKIQDAINDASDGDTIFVYNGIYYENVDINKYGISLIGEDKNSTIVDGGEVGDVILIVENNYHVTISGFTIQNAGSNIWDDAGIEIQSGFNIIIGNIIKNNPQHGIIITGRHDSIVNNITQNIVIDNKQGITLDYSIFNSVNQNYIANNCNGIFVGTSHLPSNDVSSIFWRKSIPFGDYENYIYKNIIKYNDEGIIIEPWWDTHVFNNDIIENGLGIYMSAAHLTGCYDNYIYQNNIINNSYGMLISQAIWGRHSQVEDNEIYHNNFISNKVNVLGNGNNIWIENYWDDWIGLKYILLRFLPYRIKGTLLKNIDWHPAKEPYDI